MLGYREVGLHLSPAADVRGRAVERPPELEHLHQPGERGLRFHSFAKFNGRIYLISPKIARSMGYGEYGVGILEVGFGGLGFGQRPPELEYVVEGLGFGLLTSTK